RPKKCPTPDFIFAAKDSKKSHRPRETVRPLAKRLELKVNDDYADEDFTKLARELFHDPRYAGKTVLICWHHRKIPELAASVGGDATKHWNEKCFDGVWRMDKEKSGKGRFRDLPQQLLAGDSDK